MNLPALPPAPRRTSSPGLAAAWAGVLLLWGSLLLATRTWDSYYAVTGWLAAIVTLAAGGRKMEAANSIRWRGLAMIWAQAGGWIWLADAYIRNQHGAFFAGLLIVLLLLILCRLSFSLGSLGIQSVNFLMLLVLGLPLADLMMRRPAAGAADPRQEYYSFEKGGRDPVSFAAWMAAVNFQHDRLVEGSYMRDPAGVLPFRLRPGSHNLVFGTPVNISRQGFRGRDVLRGKGPRLPHRHAG